MIYLSFAISSLRIGFIEKGEIKNRNFSNSLTLIVYPYRELSEGCHQTPYITLFLCYTHFHNMQLHTEGCRVEIIFINFHKIHIFISMMKSNVSNIEIFKDPTKPGNLRNL